MQKVRQKEFVLSVREAKCWKYCFPNFCFSLWFSPLTTGPHNIYFWSLVFKATVINITIIHSLRVTLILLHVFSCFHYYSPCFNLHSETNSQNNFTKECFILKLTFWQLETEQMPSSSKLYTPRQIASGILSELVSPAELGK